MNSDVVSLACITQAIQEEPIIVFFEEAKVSIIANVEQHDLVCPADTSLVILVSEFPFPVEITFSLVYTITLLL
jgi:hypothetical protein